MEKEKEQQMRKGLIDYIKANDNLYADKNFDNHSITSLVIIKTKIELRLLEQKKNGNNNN
ncbi:MAG: hypothetical protein KF852_00010 [Saprospiraceae bacterium]|nr:hypothetical protein [Saprospiraceae bacterium]